ncbi:PH domain-containing protein [Candidatus Roizmanbacteria bacterium]|nr:PH domain-containing protein [Candidatus Roizmanbacteria bacterium]
MEIATSPTRDKYPLSPKKIIKKTITSMIAWLFVLGFFVLMVSGMIAGIMADSNQGITTIFGAIFTGLFVFAFLFIVIGTLTYLYQRWYFAVYYYDIRDDFIVIKKGPITPKEITIPWERIQDVYVDQDIFDRMFGLFDVHLSTATLMSGMQAHIDGVEQQAADGLREVLLGKIKSRISQK